MTLTNHLAALEAAEDQLHCRTAALTDAVTTSPATASFELGDGVLGLADAVLQGIVEAASRKLVAVGSLSGPVAGPNELVVIGRSLPAPAGNDPGDRP